MDFDILQNLQRQEREGFRAGSYDEEGQWLPTWGILGSGVYITCKWRTALWFGPVLLKASIKPGTRILVLVPGELDYWGTTCKIAGAACRGFVGLSLIPRPVGSVKLTSGITRSRCSLGPQGALIPGSA